MPVDIEPRPPRDLVIFHVSGNLTVGEAVRATERHFDRSPSRFAIWDFTRASLNGLNAAALARIARCAAHYRSRCADPVTILVADTDGDVSLLRLYRELCGIHGDPARILLAPSLRRAVALCGRRTVGPAV